MNIQNSAYLSGEDNPCSSDHDTVAQHLELQLPAERIVEEN